MNKYDLIERVPTIHEFNDLRKLVGWSELDEETILKALAEMIFKLQQIEDAEQTTGVNLILNLLAPLNLVRLPDITVFVSKKSFHRLRGGMGGGCDRCNNFRISGAKTAPAVRRRSSWTGWNVRRKTGNF